LEKGAIIKGGSLLLRIDPTDYQLAIAQIEAEIVAARAQLQEIDAKAENIRASLRIEETAYELNEKEMQRKRRLVAKGNVSRSELETQERALLGQEQSVQSQRNSLNLIPSQRALLEAQLTRLEANLASANRDLAHTEVRLPFTGRIARIDVEQDRYVREGEVLAAADGLEMVEIEAQIPLEQLGGLVRSDETLDILQAAPGVAGGSALGLSARIRLSEGGLSAIWKGRVARLSDTLDPKTRTIGVIVEVDAPYANVQPGVRPPLVKGLFVEVILAGRPRPDSLVIPRFALQQGKAYVVNSDNRLEIRTLEVELAQANYLVVRDGLEPGEQLVVSDLVPAIEGMLLQPRLDEETRDRLAEWTSWSGRDD
jgi:RND family efflux transporter MFP subunit